MINHTHEDTYIPELIKHHAIKAHTGVEIQIYSFLTPTLHFLDFHAKTTTVFTD